MVFLPPSANSPREVLKKAHPKTYTPGMVIISFVNMKGGVAKTTLAVNFAHTLAAREARRVLLIDLDPQFNATQCVFTGQEYFDKRTEGANTVFDIFNDSPPSTIDPVAGAIPNNPFPLEEIAPWQIVEGFDILPGNLEIYRLDMAAGQGREQRLKRYIELLVENDSYDFIIIDTPPTPSAWMMSALLASNFYIVPVKPEPLSRTGIDLLRGIVERCSTNFGHQIDCLGVVLTIAATNTIVYRDTVAFLDSTEPWIGKRFQNFLPQRTRIARDQGNQILILDGQDASTKRNLVGIVQEFLERLENG